MSKELTTPYRPRLRKEQYSLACANAVLPFNSSVQPPESSNTVHSANNPRTPNPQSSTKLHFFHQSLVPPQPPTPPISFPHLIHAQTQRTSNPFTKTSITIYHSSPPNYHHAGFIHKNQLSTLAATASFMSTYTVQVAISSSLQLLYNTTHVVPILLPFTSPPIAEKRETITVNPSHAEHSRRPEGACRVGASSRFHTRQRPCPHIQKSNVLQCQVNTIV